MPLLKRLPAFERVSLESGSRGLQNSSVLKGCPLDGMFSLERSHGKSRPHAT